MKAIEAMKKYRIPTTTTPEELESSWSKLLTFGDKVVIAGYYYNGKNSPCYFGATYKFTTTDHSCEGKIELRAASEVEFEDDGHAIAALRLSHERFKTQRFREKPIGFIKPNGFS